MTLFVNDLLQNCFAGSARVYRAGQEDHANSVLPGSRQLEAELQTFLPKKLVRRLDQDAGAVTAIGVATGRTTMLQIEQYLERIFYDLMRAPSFNVSNKTHATSVVLIAWVVETLFCRWVLQSCYLTGVSFRYGESFTKNWGRRDFSDRHDFGLGCRDRGRRQKLGIGQNTDLCHIQTF